MLDEHSDLRPPVWKLFCLKQGYLIRVGSLWNAVDLSLIFDQVGVRHVDWKIDRAHGLSREALIGVFECADVALAGTVCEVFAEDLDRPIACDAERISKKSLTVIEGKPLYCGVFITCGRQ